MLMLSFLRSVGVLAAPEKACEVEKLEKEKATLTQQVNAHRRHSEQQIKDAERRIKPTKNKILAQREMFEKEYMPLLHIYNEKLSQTFALNAAQDVVRDHLLEVEEFIKHRNNLYAAKSRNLHAANLVFSSLSEKVNSGFPFPHELAALSRLPILDDEPFKLVETSLRTVATTGAPRLMELQQSWDGIAGNLKKEELGLPAAITTKITNISEKMAKTDVYNALSEARLVFDALPHLDTESHKQIEHWHANVLDYTVAQQGLHFLGGCLYLEQYQMIRPLLDAQGRRYQPPPQA
ncbi:hypothetical protein DIPPA_24164 [Diplonema papillatum]|nr:hypothetical protein DIPPA_24164 [Diplonema papillatum]KAJ9446085.1 hypothetical protein DIPPA_24164 [Diplonema papillatum]